MRLALVHNFYQRPGGEDQVFDAEGRLLEAYGHEVVRYTAHNSEVDHMGQLALAKATIWNGSQYIKLRELFRKAQPAVVHVHNTLPIISPAVYYAARAEGAVVIQTLHNYRVSCLNGLFLRNGRTCEDCLGKVVPWPGVVHACYRGSHTASGAIAAMLAFHKLRGTYHLAVDKYIALSEFSRQKFIEVGLPKDKLVVKPNFVAPDPGIGEGRGGYALFVGRLSEEKGISTLLAAWKDLSRRLPLKVVGDGPASDSVRAASETNNIEWLGHQSREAVFSLMKEAFLLIFPSVSYESFGLTIVEALATGTPTVASALGSMSTLVEHRRTGLHFEPGNSDDLVVQVQWALDHPDEIAAMRLKARSEFEAKYTSQANYRMLLDIYELALARKNMRS